MGTEGSFDGKNALLWASGETTICWGLEQETQSSGFLAKTLVLNQKKNIKVTFDNSKY